MPPAEDRGRRSPRATTLPLSELVSAAAARDPHGVAFSCGRRQLTFAELDRATAGVTLELAARGVRGGDRVGLLAGTGLEFVVAAHGVIRSGAVLVPVAASSPTAEASGLLKTSRAVMVLTDRVHEDAAWAAAEAYDPRCGALVIDAAAARGHDNMVTFKHLLATPPPHPPG
ncbi:MAG: AMP-binding protein, partial [Candidatus Dormibacteria bacterium]